MPVTVTQVVILSRMFRLLWVERRKVNPETCLPVANHDYYGSVEGRGGEGGVSLRLTTTWSQTRVKRRTTIIRLSENQNWRSVKNWRTSRLPCNKIERLSFRLKMQRRGELHRTEHVRWWEVFYRAVMGDHKPDAWPVMRKNHGTEYVCAFVISELKWTSSAATLKGVQNLNNCKSGYKMALIPVTIQVCFSCFSHFNVCTISS